MSYTTAVCISVPLVTAVYVIYWYGPVLRKRSPFAQQLSDARKELFSRPQLQSLQSQSRIRSFARSQQSVKVHQIMGSRAGSQMASRANSRNNSAANSRRNSLTEPNGQETNVWYQWNIGEGTRIEKMDELYESMHGEERKEIGFLGSSFLWYSINNLTIGSERRNIHCRYLDLFLIW